jgi:hypothetical protein
VHVIGHQTVGVNADLELGPIFFQAVEIGFVIFIATKGLEPLITTGDNMIKKTRGTGAARHEKSIIKIR